ncbi:MAG: T9SS type A sorting domain-containing protein [Candidatus Kapaibacterium sp.]
MNNLLLKLILLDVLLLLQIQCMFSQPPENLQFKYGSYLNGQIGAVSYDIAEDTQGNIITVGMTAGILSTTSGAYQSTFGGEWDGYISKFNPTLSTLQFSTYFGTAFFNYCTSVAVNSSGDIFVAGLSRGPVAIASLMVPSDSVFIPPVNSADSAYHFVAKFSSSGSLLFFRILGKDGAVYNNTLSEKTYLTSWGENVQYGPIIRLNAQGEAYVFANTGLSYRTTTNCYQSTHAGSRDWVLVKLDANGNTLYSTYCGGTGDDVARAMCVTNGKVYLLGTTTSGTFPLASGKSPDSQGDVTLMVWNDAATPTPVGTYIFGSSVADDVKGICFNPVRNSIMVAGATAGTDFPYTTLLQTSQNMHGFIASVKSDLSGLDYCTMIGNNVKPYSVQVRSNGDVYLGVMINYSGGIPTTPNAHRRTMQDRDGGILGLNPTCTALRYGTYVGSPSLDQGENLILLKEKPPCNNFSIIHSLYQSESFAATSIDAFRRLGRGVLLSVFQSYPKDTVFVQPKVRCGEYFFQDSSYNGCKPIRYIYNFGDGSAPVVGTDSISYLYKKNGSYTVTVSVIYPGGDTSYATITFTVQSQPTIKASPNVMYYCTKQNGLQLSASGGVRYEWSPGAVFSDSTKQNPIAKPTKNMWLYVRGYDANGCFATDSVQVYVTSVTATASSDTIVCKGTSVTLNASGGAEVKWSPSTGLNKPTGKSVVATPTETTTYQVIVGDGDCKDTTHVTISVSNKPKVTLNPAPVICTGGNVQLGAALEGSYIDTLASTYLWTPNINLSNPNIKNPVATPTKTTRYKCTVTNKYGCTITDSVEVKVQNNLKIQLSADTSVCAGYGVLLKASGGANYVWSPPDYLDNPNSATPYCTPQKNITYKVITTSGTCIDSATMNVSVHPLPTVKAQGETTVCSGQPVQLSVQQAEPNTTYTWRDSAGTSVGTGASITVNPIVETRYYVTATTNNNCTAHDSVQVHISNIMNVQALGATTVCTGTPVQLSINTPDATATYEWTTNGNIIGTGTSITVTPTQTSTFIAHGKRGGCEGWDTVTVQVNNAITITASADTSICIGATATLRVTNAQQTINYTWRDEQNNVIGNTASITVQPTQTTTYNVRGVQSGCEGAGAVRVVVHALPSILVRDTSICQGQTATVKVVNPDATNTYTWKDDKGNIVAQSTEYTTTPQTTSTYSVTVRSSEGCESSAQATITIEPKTTVHLFVAPIRDSIQIGDTIRVQVFAQSDRDVQLQQVEYDIQTETDVMDIPTSVHSGQWQQLHVQQAITLSTTPIQIYEFTGKALVTQTRQATLSIENLSTNLNPECRIQTSKGTTFITGTACAINILKFRLTGTELLLSPNPSTGEVIITSDDEIEEIQVVNALGQTVTSPTSSPKERTSSPSPSERSGVRSRSGTMPRVEHKVQIESSGLYFIRVKVNGEWITKSVVVQR